MTDEKKQTKAGATELSEEELNEVQGGFKFELDGATQGKKANKPKPETTSFSHEVTSPRQS